MIWTLLLFTTLSLAQDSAVEQYCFSSPAKMSLVASKLQIVLVPTDKLEKDNNCFTVSMKPHRRELIQSYIRNLDPTVAISFSSAEIKSDPCHLKIEKVRSLNKTQTQADISSSPDVMTTQTHREVKETTTIQTLKDFELAVDQDVIKGTCRVITPTRYEINLEVRKDLKPLIPGLPEGSIVIINHPVAPPDQETSLLKTSLQLTQGQRLEIGSVVKDLRNKQHKADASTPQVVLDQTTGDSEQKVFLSLE